jgi:hypothetical protein
VLLQHVYYMLQAWCCAYISCSLVLRYCICLCRTIRNATALAHAASAYFSYYLVLPSQAAALTFALSVSVVCCSPTERVCRNRKKIEREELPEFKSPTYACDYGYSGELALYIHKNAYSQTIRLHLFYASEPSVYIYMRIYECVYMGLFCLYFWSLMTSVHTVSCSCRRMVTPAADRPGATTEETAKAFI